MEQAINKKGKKANIHVGWLIASTSENPVDYLKW